MMIDELFGEFMAEEIKNLPPLEKIKLAKALGISYFTMMNKAHGRGRFTAKQQEKYRKWRK